MARRTGSQIDEQDMPGQRGLPAVTPASVVPEAEVGVVAVVSTTAPGEDELGRDADELDAGGVASSPAELLGGEDGESEGCSAEGFTVSVTVVVVPVSPPEDAGAGGSDDEGVVEGAVDSVGASSSRTSGLPELCPPRIVNPPGCPPETGVPLTVSNPVSRINAIPNAATAPMPARAMVGNRRLALALPAGARWASAAGGVAGS